MSDYTSFTVEQYEEVSVLKWTESAAKRVLHNGELRVELQAFVLTTKPRCVIASFTRLTQCPSSLVGGLIGLNKQLKERSSSLTLCEMNQLLREQFEQLNVDRVFQIADSAADAITACEESIASGGECDQDEIKH
jgi:anti-anti-sigma regulatory factor